MVVNFNERPNLELDGASRAVVSLFVAASGDVESGLNIADESRNGKFLFVLLTCGTKYSTPL